MMSRAVCGAGTSLLGLFCSKPEDGCLWVVLGRSPALSYVSPKPALGKAFVILDYPLMSQRFLCTCLFISLFCIYFECDLNWRLGELAKFFSSAETDSPCGDG